MTCNKDLIPGCEGDYFGAVGMVFLLSVPVIALLWMSWDPGQSNRNGLPGWLANERVFSYNLSRHVSAVGSKPHNIEHPKAPSDPLLEIGKKSAHGGRVLTWV